MDFYYVLGRRPDLATALRVCLPMLGSPGAALNPRRLHAKEDQSDLSPPAVAGDIGVDSGPGANQERL